VCEDEGCADIHEEVLPCREEHKNAVDQEAQLESKQLLEFEFIKLE